MITVYFENTNGQYSEIVAKFDSEDLYLKYLPILEKDCIEKGFDTVTESITDLEL